MRNILMKYLLIILWLNGSQAVISYPNQLECEMAQTRLIGKVQQAYCVPGGY